MATPKLTMNICRFPHDCTLRIIINWTREFRLRYWLGKQLMLLAARVLGCGIEIEG